MNTFLKLLLKHTWLIVPLGTLLYIVTIGFDFAYDDYLVILDNTFVHEGFSSLKKLFTHSYTYGSFKFNDGLYRPLSTMMFAIEWELVGKQAWLGHLINIILYGTTGYVSVNLLQKLGFSQLQSLAATLVFLVHPLHTEIVANIKSRDEILGLLFGLLTTSFFIEYLKSKQVKFLPLVILMLFLSMLGKESSIIWALIIPILSFHFVKKISAQHIMPFALLALTGIVWFSWRTYVVNSMESEVSQGIFSKWNNMVFLADNPLDRVASGAYITLLYIWKSIVPYPLVSDYSPNAIPFIPFLSFWGISSILFHLGVLVLSIKLIKKDLFLALLILCLYISLAPVSNIFKLIGVTYAERLGYTPSLFVILIALRIAQLYGESFFKKYQYMLIGLVALFTGLTVVRTLDWKDNLTLFSADVSKAPESYRANYNYATALNRAAMGDHLGAHDVNLLSKSVPYYLKAIEINPNFVDGRNNLANTYRRLFKHNEAIAQFQKIIELDPKYSKAYFNMGISCLDIQQYENGFNALQQYLAIGGVEQQQAYYWSGVALGHLQRFPEAIPMLKQAIQLKADHADAWNFLGMAYGNSNLNQDALKAFEKAYQLAPENKQIQANYEFALQKSKQ